MKVVLAYPSFAPQFLHHFPDMEMAQTVGVVEEADLIIFPGGADIEPEIYNEKNTKSYTNPRRDAWELTVLRIAEKKKRAKYLGICRGHQLLNAFFGGKLLQDIKPEHPNFHSVNSISDDAFEDELFPFGVNSLHHQGVIKPGKGFTPLSSLGEIIEATISDTILSVQYHPEFMGKHGVPFFDYVKKWAKK